MNFKANKCSFKTKYKTHISDSLMHKNCIQLCTFYCKQLVQVMRTLLNYLFSLFVVTSKFISDVIDTGLQYFKIN